MRPGKGIISSHGWSICVVLDNHKITNFKNWIKASDNICHKNILNAKYLHYTNGQGYLKQFKNFNQFCMGHAVTIIRMEASLREHHILVRQSPKYEIAVMSRGFDL